MQKPKALALAEKFQSNVVEGDAKICFDTLNGVEDCKYWKIDFICADIRMLSFSFIACTYLWVRRKANNLAHVLVKFVFVQNYDLCCNKTSLPPPVYETWLRDSLICSV